MQGIKRKLKYIDTWLHDLLMNNENLYFRIASTALPNNASGMQATLIAIHAYDVKRFGSISMYKKAKILFKNKLFAMYQLTRKKTLSALLRMFLFRDRILGRQVP